MIGINEHTSQQGIPKGFRLFGVQFLKCIRVQPFELFIRLGQVLEQVKVSMIHSYFMHQEFLEIAENPYYSLQLILVGSCIEPI